MKKSMLHTLAAGALLTGMASTPAMALDDDTLSQALGGGVGGAIGAAIGNEIGGRKGAMIGGAAGAAGGSWIINERNDDRYYDDRGYRDRRGHDRGYGRYGYR